MAQVDLKLSKEELEIAAKAGKAVEPMLPDKGRDWKDDSNASWIGWQYRLLPQMNLWIDGKNRLSGG